MNDIGTLRNDRFDKMNPLLDIQKVKKKGRAYLQIANTTMK